MIDLVCTYGLFEFPCGSSAISRAADVCWRRGVEDHTATGKFPYDSIKFKPGYEACEKVWAEYAAQVRAQRHEADELRKKSAAEQLAKDMEIINKIANRPAE